MDCLEGLEAMQEQCDRAKARIHGLAGWRTLQFMDADEEAAFTTNEFRSSRDTIIVSACSSALMSQGRAEVHAICLTASNP